jgi:hypothetical protein
LIHQYVVTYLSRLSDYHPRTMVYKEAPAYFGSGVDFYPGQKAANM